MCVRVCVCERERGPKNKIGDGKYDNVDIHRIAYIFHTHIQTIIHTANTYIDVQAYIHTHAYTHTRIHTYTHTRAYTHTHMPNTCQTHAKHMANTCTYTHKKKKVEV